MKNPNQRWFFFCSLFWLFFSAIFRTLLLFNKQTHIFEVNQKGRNETNIQFYSNETQRNSIVGNNDHCKRAKKKSQPKCNSAHIHIFLLLFFISLLNCPKKMERSKSCTCNRISAQRIMTNIFRSVFFLLLFLLFFIFFSSFFLHFSIFISLLRPYKINIGCVLLNRLRKNDGQTLKK